MHNFLDIVDKRIINIIKKQKTPKCWYGTVTVGGSDSATVTLAGNTTPLSGSILNKSGETLLPNDNVVLFSPTGSLSNSVILFKF
jgi:hypothetical protein